MLVFKRYFFSKKPNKKNNTTETVKFNDSFSYLGRYSICFHRYGPSRTSGPSRRDSSCKRPKDPK